MSDFTMPETRRASKLTEPPTMAGDNSPGLRASGTDGGAGDGSSPAASGAAPPTPAGVTSPTNPEVTAPQVVDLTDNNAAMVKLFERLLVLSRVRHLSLSWTRALIRLQPSMIWMMMPLKAFASYAENQNLDTLLRSVLRHSSSSATFTFGSRP